MLSCSPRNSPLVGKLVRPGKTDLLVGLVAGGLGGLIVAAWASTVAGLEVGACGCLGTVAILMYTKPSDRPADELTPLHLFGNDLLAGTVLGLIGSLSVGLAILACLHSTPIGGSRSIIIAATGAVLFSTAAIVMASQSVALLLTSCYLALRDLAPLRILSFLNDAQKRQLLRVVGAEYQFRHGDLQDPLTRH